MLLANTIVAEYLMKEAKEKALIRVHDDISETSKMELKEFFTTLGIFVDMRNQKTL